MIQFLFKNIFLNKLKLYSLFGNVDKSASTNLIWKQSEDETVQQIKYKSFMLFHSIIK